MSRRGPPDPSQSLRALFALAFISGAAALVYELVWMRWFRLLFGSTAYAASATLCAFFAGMAIGAIVFGRFADRVRHPLRAYGWLEAGAAAGALWVPIVTWFYDPLYVALYEAVAGQRGTFVLVKFALALIAMLPVTVLLGGTLPMLARALPDGAHALGKHGSALYAANTVGAAMGALLGSLAFPERIGIPATYALGILGTLVASIGGFRLARRHRARAASTATTPAAAETAAAAPLFIAFASGFGTLAFEVLLIHSLGQLYSHSAYSFGMVLFVVLVSLGLSAALVSAFSARVHAPTLIRASVLAEALLLLAMPAALLASRGMEGGGLFNLLNLFGLEEYWITAVFIVGAGLPTFLVAGTVFPLTFHLTPSGPTGTRVGGLLAANTVGGILGSVFASFVLLEYVGLWKSVGWLGVLYGVAAVSVPGPRPVRLWTTAAFAVLVAGVGLTSLNPWRLPIVTLAAEESLVAVREGPHGIVSVVERPNGERRIKVDDRYEFGNTREGDLYERMGQLPLLLHPAPRRVAFVGSATGSVAAAALPHPVERIDLIELVPEVHELAAEHFSVTNQGVHRDPRTRIVAEDGRNHLRAAPDRYDVIVEDLFVPYRPSAAAMYSRDHYRDVKAHLTKDGVFCQWLPIYQLREETLLIIAATFDEVFPRATLWRPHLRGQPAIAGLIGTLNQELSTADIAARTEALARLGVEERWVTDPRAVWLMYIGPVATIFDGRPKPALHTDRHPIFEFVGSRHIDSVVLRYSFDGWPRLTQRLVESTKATAVFPERPRTLIFGANALAYANLAVAVGDGDLADRAVDQAWQSIPEDLLHPPDPTFSHVWPPSPPAGQNPEARLQPSERVGAERS